MPSRERRSSNGSVLITLFAVIGLLIVADSLGREQKRARTTPSLTQLGPMATGSTGSPT